MQKTVFKYLLILLLSLATGSVSVFAQHYDSQLAAEYLRKKEFDKAVILYEKLYKEHSYSSYRTNYLRCLNELEEYDTAEKFLKKEIRKNKNDISLIVELGNIYYTQKDTLRANKEFIKAINLASTSKAQTVNTANSFIMHRQFTYAQKMYEVGAKKQLFNYDYELANIYYYQRDYEKMINKFLDLVISQPKYINNVQARLQSISASNRIDNLDEMIERNMILRIQSNPESGALNELLIWQYSQTGKYKEALNQTIAFDKRERGRGFKVLQFGRILKDNEEYALAMEAFKYVMDQGEELINYQIASIEYLNTLYNKVINTPNRSKEELIELEVMLIDVLSKIRKSRSFTLVYALANIQAFYLNKTPEAVSFLKIVIDENKLKPFEIAEIKLLYGDILLLNNNQWEATIVYAQVENANSNNPYGHEARFRKAKLAYYTGQFEWAQAQLDVLKASTSKLIANDAFELSMFINENTALDTSEVAMQMFARADLLIYKHSDSLALLCLDSIQDIFPTHVLSDDIYFKKGKIKEQEGKTEEAIEMYNKVLQNYSFDILADNALFKIAKLYDHGLNNKAEAMKHYEKMLLEYPGSIFTVEARKRYRFLRGDQLETPEE